MAQISLPKRWQAITLDGRQAVFCGDRGRAISAMAVAFERFIASRDDVAALLGLGGSGGTALITPAMQSLPIGIPKLMVSTMASAMFQVTSVPVISP